MAWPFTIAGRGLSWLVLGIVVLCGVALLLVGPPLEEWEEEETEVLSSYAPPSLSETEEVGASHYFVDMRLERDRVRSREIALLMEISRDPEYSEEMRRESEKRLLELMTRHAWEFHVEGVLRSKGFEEALVLLAPERASVVVMGDVEGMAASIGDAVASVTELGLHQITVVQYDR